MREKKNIIYFFNVFYYYFKFLFFLMGVEYTKIIRTDWGAVDMSRCTEFPDYEVCQKERLPKHKFYGDRFYVGNADNICITVIRICRSSGVVLSVVFF